MGGELRRTGFDYGDLPEAEARAMERYAATFEEIQDYQRRLTADGIRKLGMVLVEAQERLANHGNGTFKRWVRERLGVSPQTAYRAMRSAEFLRDRSTVERFFEPAALYAITEPSCPQAARQEALRIADSGRVVTQKRAKEIVAKHKPPKPRPSPAVIEATARRVDPDPEPPPAAKGPADMLAAVQALAAEARDWPDDEPVKAEALRALAYFADVLADVPSAYELVSLRSPQRQPAQKRAGTTPKDIERQAAEIYEAYPRKAARPAALRAIKKAMSRIGFKELHAHVCRYAVAVQGADKAKIPHPGTWFNDERWHDGEAEWRRSCGLEDGKANGRPRTISTGLDAFLGRTAG